MKELTKLIKQARSGPKTQRHEAFSSLVNRFQTPAYYWAYQQLGDTYLAQDAVQEAFVIAYQNLPQLQHPAAFASWFRQIVYSQCQRLVRNKHLPITPIDEAPEIPAPTADLSSQLEALELQENVMQAVQALPESEREVTKMFYLNGYSQKEIAKMLELPLTTVKKRLQYARQRLKLIMTTMFGPEPNPVLVPVPVRPYRPTPPTRRRPDAY